MEEFKITSKNGFRALVVVLSGIMTVSAFAETEEQKGVFRAGFDFSLASLEVNELEPSDEIAIAWGLKVGYESPNGFGVELGSRKYVNANFFSTLIPGTDVTLEHSILYVLPTYTWAYSNNTFLRAKLGFGRWASDYAVNIDPERNSNDRENRTETGIDPYLGIEGGFQFKHVELGLFYDYQSADFVEVKGGGIALSYRF
ncbi:outer membrane beta-barrel protein [Teredinibacter franksiae]|uniref:outer membrane beta-barrel protein n=1 Tax=Teredinibacter franksiae TaxID=2761453 RepID=UPI001629A0D4|nr:outer membrane beta-barrel protein [Teredinibacter franksiae]